MSNRSSFPKWTWLRRSCALAFLVMLGLGAYRWFPWFKGSANATLFWDAIPFTDPLAALEYFLATRTVDLSILTGALILIGFCLVLGPIFCGWFCPLGLMLDVVSGFRKRIFKKTTAGFKALEPIRFVILGSALGLSLLWGLPLFQTISPINFMSWLAAFSPEVFNETEEGVSTFLPMLFAAGGGMLAFLSLILLFEVVLHPFWCRTLCPLGALYSLIGFKAPFKVTVSPDRDACKPCKRCHRACPMGISVMDEFTLKEKTAVDHLNCTRCGACIDVCPRDVLHMGKITTTGNANHNSKSG